MKRMYLFVLLLTSLLLSCGMGKSLKPPAVETGYIRSLSIVNNVLTFTTEDSSYVHITYSNRTVSGDSYEGWSAGEPAKVHSYILPAKDGTNTYNFKLAVEGEKTYKDTLWTGTITTTPKPLMKVHFINVQQGDAILIETPENRYVQIDGGWGRRGRSPSEGGGVPIALNYLIERNITQLDYIIETHKHQDHYGGLEDIVSADIGGQYLSNDSKLNYNVGDFLNLDSEVSFQILNLDYPYGVPSNYNNKSIVIKATYKDAEFLFTGDAQKAVQDWLYDQNYDISVDVLKVSHHGASSDNTTDSVFLEKTLNQYARIAILSYGADNDYGHPRSPTRFSKAQTYGTNPIATPPAGTNYHWDCGHIVVYTDGKMIYISTEK